MDRCTARIEFNAIHSVKVWMCFKSPAGRNDSSDIDGRGRSVKYSEHHRIDGHSSAPPTNINGVEGVYIAAAAEARNPQTITQQSAARGANGTAQPLNPSRFSSTSTTIKYPCNIGGSHSPTEAVTGLLYEKSSMVCQNILVLTRDMKKHRETRDAELLKRFE